MTVLLPLPARRPDRVPTPAPGCDCRVCPFFTGNPDAAEPICSGCNSDCAYCSCARAEAQAPTSACRTCPVRCGSRVDIAAWMADVGGTLGFDDVVVTGTLPAGLPRFVPQVDGSNIAELDEGLRWPAYAVGLRRVFSPDRHRLYPKFTLAASAHTALGLAPGQLAVLACYGEDPLVEAFWTRRRVDRLVERLAAMGWDLVLAPNYSLYQSQPRTEHLLNFRRNLLVAQELCDAGLAAVPNLYWMRLEDLTRYLDWVADTSPPAVAVNLQTFRQQASWENYALPGLTYLATTLPPDLPVILTGSSRDDRIATLRHLFGPRLVLVSQNPAQYAMHGAVMTHTGRLDAHARAGDAFAASVRHVAALLAAPEAEPRAQPPEGAPAPPAPPTPGGQL